MTEYPVDDPIDETNSKSPSQASIGLKEVFLTPTSAIPARRKVSFAPLMHLVLVPCLRDYRQANLMDTMWYRASDFYEFQQASHEEIRQMAAYDSSSHSDARRKLYQPSGDELALSQHFETSPVVSKTGDDAVEVVSLLTLPLAPPRMHRSVTFDNLPSLELEQHSQTSPVASKRVEQDQDEVAVEAASSFAKPLGLLRTTRSVSLDNLARLKSQCAEATSASRTTVAGALRRSRSCSSIGSGSRVRSQSLTPVLTESCVRRIFRNNSMDKLKAQGLSRGETTTTTTPEVPSPTDGMQNPREILAGLDEVLCVPGPYIELRDESQPTGRRSQSLFGALSKAVSRDVLSRLLAWSTVLTFTVLLASATAPAPDTATCSLA